ncbi:L-fucose mutarotase [Bacteroidota bacterium]
MKTWYLACDLKNDPELIKAYELAHKQVWPEIIQSIYDAGILNCEIYRVHNRLLMVLETTDEFSFETKAQMDAINPTVQQWEELMWKYQLALPEEASTTKWVLMKQIFSLNDQEN